MREINKNEFNKLYNGSWYTIVGADGDLEEWEKGVQDLLDSKDIGKVKEWVTYKGKDMNEWAQLSEENAYPEDLTFISFSLDGLDLEKLAIFKVQMQDRWFDDIVDNNARREGFHPIKSELNESKLLTRISKPAEGEFTADMKLRDAYKIYDPEEFQLDLIRNDITVEELWKRMQNGESVYVIASVDGEGFDSVVREGIFNIIEQALNIEYDTIYNTWLNPKKLTEDTIKQNGKWVNKGKEGTHGKFKTKKEANAQRKAMFANGYKTEAVEKSYASKLSRKELAEIIWEVLDQCIEYSMADTFYMDTHLDPNFDSLRDISTEDLRWIVDELNKKGYLDQQFYDDQAAGIDWEPNKYIVREAVDSMGRNRPDTYKKRESKKKNLSYQIYDDLERLGYNVFASRDTYRYEISKKHEKNLDKAKDLLNNLKVPYKVKEIRGRFYLTVFLKPEQEEQEKKSYSKHDKSLDEDINQKSIYFTRKPSSIKEIKDYASRARQGYELQDYIIMDTYSTGPITIITELDSIIKETDFQGGFNKQGIRQVIAVDDKTGTYLVDPQGFDYARYVAYIPNKNIKENLNTFDYDKLQKELEAIPNVTKVEFDKDLIYDTNELVVLITWHSDNDTAQWFKDKTTVKAEAIKIFKDNNLKLTDPVEDNGNYYYFVLREAKPIKEDIVKSIEPLDPEVEREIEFTFNATDKSYPYGMLGRLQSDCDYILGALKDENEDKKLPLDIINKFLWFHDIDKQIEFMKGIYNRLDEKPEWITLEDIEDYRNKLKEIIRIEKLLKEDYQLILLFKDKNGQERSLRVSYNRLQQTCKAIREDGGTIIGTIPLDESLKEDINQDTFDESALVTLLNDLINDENDAINGYESAIASLASINKNDYDDVFKDIIKEEQNHIGQLQKILDDIKPGTINELEKGQDEASEQISEEKI